MEELRGAYARRLAPLALAAGVEAALFDPEGLWIAPEAPGPGQALCALICGCPQGRTRCRDFHRFAGFAAQQTGEAYIARCPAGAVVVTCSLSLEGNCRGSAAIFPLWLWEWDADAQAELRQRTRDLPLSLEALQSAGARVPVADPARVQALSSLLKELTGAVLPSPFGPEGLDPLLQERSPELPLASPEALFPEDELLERVRSGDRKGARALLNRQLEEIFLGFPGNLDLMKARLLELVTRLSRAAVASGGELPRLLGQDYGFLSQLSALEDYEDISAWVVRVLDTFLDAASEARGQPDSRRLAEALAYIRQRHMQPLTLEAVAAQVYVSPFYLSHLFKEKLGLTFVEYLTRVRLEMAKSYLLNTGLSVSAVAERVGFADPGYFGKVFKRATGLTPRAFRRGK